MKIEFTQASRYIGPDERDRVLEIIAVTTEVDSLLVVHVMPYHYREGS